MQLTPNFSLDEFTRSDKARELGIENELSLKTLGNIQATALCLEQARALLFDYPITIHSGYRSPALNAAVGGVKNSDHVAGWAADITAEGYDPWEVATRLNNSPLVFDQLILETGRGIVHLSFNPRLRRQVFTQKGGPGSPFDEGVVV